jgi:ubiquinone/menaquinone biosynthesis C-methylase UbiE
VVTCEEGNNKRFSRYDFGEVKKMFSKEPEDKELFTKRFDEFYSRYANVYNFIVNRLSFWRRWIGHALPYVIGPRVLEISFGTGYLLTQFALDFETYGIDYNQKFVDMVKDKLTQMNIHADIRRGDVYELPFEEDFFDCVVNTMAFSGYPDGEGALLEIKRVIKPGGRLVMIDVNYPQNGNWLGVCATRAWAIGGDIIRDIDALLQKFDFEYTSQEVGGFGSVHLYVAEKKRT